MRNVVQATVTVTPCNKAPSQPDLKYSHVSAGALRMGVIYS